MQIIYFQQYGTTFHPPKLASVEELVEVFRCAAHKHNIIS